MKEWLKRMLVVEKLNNPIGYSILVFIALTVSFLIATQGLFTALIILSAVIMFPILGISLFNFRFGLFAVLIFTFLSLILKQAYPGIPWGLSIDLIIASMILGMLVQRHSLRPFLNQPIAIAISVWIGYCVVLLFNPIASSKLVWFYAMREIAGVMFLYFAGCYALNSMKSVWQVSFLLIGLSLFCAFYGLRQKFSGLLPSELSWIYQNPIQFYEIFEEERMRIFSFLWSPALFGILTAAMSLFCLVLALEPVLQRRARFLLGIISLLMGWVMQFSETRVAYYIFLIGLIFYAILSLKRRAMLSFLVIVGTSLSCLILFPENAFSKRLLYAFQPYQSEAYAIRMYEHDLIQPYIQSHALGSGIGSLGHWAERFSPESPLSGVSVPGGYHRIGVETGWFGLLIYCLLMFTILATGVFNYFRTQDSHAKALLIAYLVLILGFVIANFSQVSLPQKPVNIIFVISIIAISKLRTLTEHDSELS